MEFVTETHTDCNGLWNSIIQILFVVSYPLLTTLTSLCASHSINWFMYMLTPLIITIH